ncbi:MAG: prolipoprotein diacylglyceryl transferase [Williamsia sp.]|nr:prolipoprotein diacylglyceryl transferase [Williamsia sp.]
MPLIYIQWSASPFIIRIGGFELRYYSLLFAVAFWLGYVLVKKMFQKEHKPEELLTPLIIYIIAGTVIGARLGQTLFYEFGYFKNHPLEIVLPFRISSGGFEWTGYQGLASHGGAIGILPSLAFYCRKYKQDFLQTIDKLVIAVALAGFFIRLGNFFNSEIIGMPTTLPWGVVFSRVDNIPRHPAQLYEALAYLSIFVWLWSLYKQHSIQLRKGFLFGLFLVLVFTARFLIEFIKEDQEAFEKGWLLNMGQLLSIPFIVAGIYFMTRRNKHKADIYTIE